MGASQLGKSKVSEVEERQLTPSTPANSRLSVSMASFSSFSLVRTASLTPPKVPSAIWRLRVRAGVSGWSDSV